MTVSRRNIKAVILTQGSIPWGEENARPSISELTLLNRPFLEHQIEAFRSLGIHDICLVSTSQATVRFAAKYGIDSRYDPIPAGTAGALRTISGWLDGSAFLLCYGSTYLDPLCLRSLLENSAKAQKPNWAATVGVTERRIERFGDSLEVCDAGGFKNVYRRHQSADRRKSGRFAGIYLLSAAAIDFIPDAYFDLKEQLFPLLKDNGYGVETHPATRSFPVQSMEAYLQLQFKLLQSLGASVASDVTPRPQAYGGSIIIGQGCMIAADARVIGPVIIGDGVSIDSGALVIGPTAIGDGVKVGRSAYVHCSILSSHVVLGEAAEVHFTFIGSGQTVRNRTRLDGNPAVVSVLRLGVGSAVDKRGQRRVSQSRVWLSSMQLRSRSYALIKRWLDILFSTGLLVVSSPLWLAIAIAIRYDSPGPVLFRQQRCGQGGRTFPMLKFRTMVANASSLQGGLRGRNETDGPVFKIMADPRITAVGRFLRKTSLDELPQLINVLVGQMTFVGPRPLVMDEMRLNPYWRDLRLSVRPGITGLWQVEGRNKNHFYSWVLNDVEYVQTRSLLVDTKILFKTFLVVLKGA